VRTGSGTRPNAVAAASEVAARRARRPLGRTRPAVAAHIKPINTNATARLRFVNNTDRPSKASFRLTFLDSAKAAGRGATTAWRPGAELERVFALVAQEHRTVGRRFRRTRHLTSHHRATSAL
jgi:hypothetical protein